MALPPSESAGGEVTESGADSSGDARHTLLAPDSGSEPSPPSVDGSPEPAVVASGVVPGTRLADRYRIVRVLGRGGMGTVYEARDETLDRTVALKVIRPDLAAEPETLQRFKREVQLASQVTHPNVLRVYDIGESDGIVFLTMQYVEGETLGELMDREGRLPVKRSERIFREICQGLDAAHERGVVHRDLKPSNVMLDEEGRVYVTDFGLARGLAETGLTQTGAAVGTPHYMSPEQVRGESADARSDVYALGVMLYEMLTGRMPFEGVSSLEVMFKRLRESPPSVTEHNPEVSENLRAIVERCLTRKSENRYRTADEILDDLGADTVRLPAAVRLDRWRRFRWVALAIIGGIVVIGLVWWSVGRVGGDTEADGREAGGGATATGEIPVVGIAPFTNRSGDPALDWYEDGVARLVADDLSRSRHLRVVSVDRMSDFVGSTTHSDRLRATAAEAGLDQLVTGAILRGDRGLTVVARLQDVEDERQLTSKRLDGLEPEEMLGASDELALAVRRGLGVPLEESVDAYAADFAVANPEAYEAYVEGLRAFTSYEYESAVEAFSRALERASDFTMARYRLAHALASQGNTEAAQEQIARAAAAADSLPDREERYVRAGKALIERRNEEAIAEYRQIVERYPYETEARRQLAELYQSLEQWDAALQQAEELQRLAPEAPTTWSLLGRSYLGREEFSRAVQALQRYVERAPREPNAHHLLADSYRAQGEFELAAQEYRRALELDPGFHFSTVALATTRVLQGELDVAEDLLAPVVADEETLRRYRGDAAFALANVRRAEGRFRDAASVLRSIETLLAEEKVREAWALSIRGLSRMEIGELGAARQLIEWAIERSPGVPTRYLFARGILELREGRLEAVRTTSAEILEHALPPENPDRTEEKAAAYLEGMVHLRGGAMDQAIRELSSALALSGHEYRRYRLGLARAYLEAGRLQEAMAAAREAAAALDSVDPRLDLELDRRRALLVLARVQSALGRPEKAAAQASEVLELWSEADREFRALSRARGLAAESAA